VIHAPANDQEPTLRGGKKKEEATVVSSHALSRSRKTPDHKEKGRGNPRTSQIVLLN